MVIPLALNVGCSDSGSEDGTGATGGAGATGGTAGSGGEIPPEPYAGNLCVGAKQAAASTFCETVFDAWATWET
ncbi:MAG: hypothetical protein O7F08_02355, partial [Deltaproteobacteria bacterium]|nr:hypothetical protein [Deltaproteobacteria bacterium]